MDQSRQSTDSPIPHYAEQAQAELQDYAARVANGRGLLRELRDWTSNYSPRVHCDVRSLMGAMPPKTGEEFLRAVSEHYKRPQITALLHQMTDAGVRLQAGIYGVDQPDTGTIRRGLSYMRNVFGERGQPDALLTALEYAVITQQQPLQLQALAIKRTRNLPFKADYTTRHHPAQKSDGPLSMAEQLAARFGDLGISR